LSSCVISLTAIAESFTWAEIFTWAESFTWPRDSYDRLTVRRTWASRWGIGETMEHECDGGLGPDGHIDAGTFPPRRDPDRRNLRQERSGCNRLPLIHLTPGNLPVVFSFP
jgi:hypothetical protein